eukprot:6455134-Amphidinium_carterae.1
MQFKRSARTLLAATCFLSLSLEWSGCCHVQDMCGQQAKDTLSCGGLESSSEIPFTTQEIRSRRST